jgi:F-type H+-transporting ATPase subunit gamma
VSALSFEATVMEVYDAEALKRSPNLAAYEIEDDGLLQDLASFALANGIYAALVEGHAAEVGCYRPSYDLFFWLTRFGLGLVSS